MKELVMLVHEIIFLGFLCYASGFSAGYVTHMYFTKKDKKPSCSTVGSAIQDSFDKHKAKVQEDIEYEVNLDDCEELNDFDLPSAENVGQLHFHKIYEEYNTKPLLYSCVNNAGTFFLGLLVAPVDEETERWLYCEISPERLNLVELGKINLYDAFKKSEHAKVIELILSPDGFVENTIKTEDVLDSDLPFATETIYYFDDDDDEDGDELFAFNKTQKKLLN